MIIARNQSEKGERMHIIHTHTPMHVLGSSTQDGECILDDISQLGTTNSSSIKILPLEFVLVPLTPTNSKIAECSTSTTREGLLCFSRIAKCVTLTF